MASHFVMCHVTIVIGLLLVNMRKRKEQEKKRKEKNKNKKRNKDILEKCWVQALQL